jgi:hypothetical protein
MPAPPRSTRSRPSTATSPTTTRSSTSSSSRASEYPSDEELIAAIEAECLDPAFADYFGEPYETSEIEVFPITPTPESWDEADDREVVCAGYIDGERVEGSLQGSGR